MKAIEWGCTTNESVSVEMLTYRFMIKNEKGFFTIFFEDAIIEEILRKDNGYTVKYNRNISHNWKWVKPDEQSSGLVIHG